MTNHELKIKDDELASELKKRFPFPTIDVEKIKRELDFQVENYGTLPFLKSLRGRLAVIFAFLVNVVLLLYIQRQGVDSLVLFTLALDVLLIFVAKGYRLAMYPLMFFAFVYPLALVAYILPNSTILEPVGVFVGIALDLRLMLEIYKTIQVENLKSHNGNRANSN